jgi:lipocalin-like protein
MVSSLMDTIRGDRDHSTRSEVTMRALLAMLALMLLPPGLAFGEPPLKERLVGTWRGVSWVRIVDGKEEAGPWGEKPLGVIMYGADGYMCANVMMPDRPKFAGRDFRAASAEEKVAAHDSYFGYCGRYEVLEAEGVVMHNVEAASFPNFTGTAQKRFVQLSGDRLTIKTPPAPYKNGSSYFVIRFERAK